MMIQISKKARHGFLWTICLLTIFSVVLTACAPTETAQPEEPPTTAIEEPAVEEPAVEEPIVEEPASEEESELPPAEEIEEEGTPQFEPISILIPENPWVPALQTLTKMYEEETGNVVNVNLTPFQGMIQKSVNAVQAPESEFDIIALNEALLPMFYASQWAIPLSNIDPEFELDPEIISYENAARWDPELGISTPDSLVYGIPINGNVQLFFYRADLYEEHGLSAPETWADVEEAAEILADPPDIYGYALRTNPPNISTQVFIKAYGGSLLDYDLDSGQWIIGVNDERSVEAIEYSLKLAEAFGPPNWQSIGQAEMMTLMASGKLAQGIMISSVAEAIDDPNMSLVAGDVAATVVPRPVDGDHAAMTGIWMLIIPHNTIEAHQPAALAFIEWATSREAQLAFAQAGGTPVRADVYEELQDDPDYGWWMSAILDTIPYMYTLPRTPYIESVLNPFINNMGLAIVGDLTPQEALDQTALTMFEALTDIGLNVKPINE